MHECEGGRRTLARFGIPAFLHFCIPAFLVVAAALPAQAAVDDYLGRPVATMQLVLDGRETTDPALLQVVETRVGRALSMLDVRESVTHLYSLGRFDDVSVDASMEGTGVALRYVLSPIHVVAKIDFTGNLGAGVDEGVLKRAVTDRYGTSPPLGRVTELSRVIDDVLVERGYRHATIEPRADIDHGSERATLVFTIDPGPRTLIGQTIDIVGMPSVSRETLLKQLDVAPGVPYQPGALANRIARYIEARRKAGYYEAQVTPSVRFSDGDRVANLSLAIMPGAHVRLVFAGDALPSERRDEFVPVEAEGTVDEDLLEDSTNRIEDYLRGQGYRDAQAPHTREQRDDEVVITFTVTRGSLYRVTRVTIDGNASVPLAELSATLRTHEGAPFSQALLDADQTSLERLYRGRGFASVTVQADAKPNPAALAGGQVPVTISLGIIEGVRTIVGTVRIEGNTTVAESSLRRVMGMQSGTPYFDARLRTDADAIQLQYANLGYRSATVEPQAGFTADKSQANPVFTVREGPRIFVDHILIAGNIRTNARTIERELQLKPGDPLSLAAVQESQRRLAALQLFRRAPQITELRHGNETTRDLLVTVEEATPTTLEEGAGLEGRLRVVPSDANGGAVEKFEVAPRAFIGYGRRNLFGKNRSVNLFGSVSLHPPDVSSGATIGYGFTEYRLLATFHEPRLSGTSIDGLVTGVIEQQIRSSFNLARRSAGVQVARKLASNLTLSGGYQLQHTRLFDVHVTPEDQSLIDRAFTTVRLSSVSMSGFYDTRDDQVEPSSGGYLSATVQLAARSLGSEVGFAKSSLAAQLVRTIPRSRGIVFVGMGRLGLATGFPRDVVTTDPSGNEVVDKDVRDLPEAERFFAGGDTTVRGFALDTLGTPETIKDGFPIGGNAETIFNAELRVPVRGGLGVVGFFDTGNVFAHVVDIDLRDLRSAVGFGLRYKSPIGPLRIDLGFKVKPEPGEGLSAWFISFGQAF